MDLNIFTGYPDWYYIICIISGILASMVLYYRERKNEFSSTVKWALGVTRFLVVSLVVFLLLAPMFKQLNRTTEKPIVVVAQDNSMSLVMSRDSLHYRTGYPADLNALIARLQEDYEVRLFTFGEEVRDAGAELFDTLAFDEHQTDISALFDMMDVRFSNRNTGALVIATDGIVNKGVNPLYEALPVTYPVYTIALGDTSVRRDAFIRRVQYNRIAFQGNDFPVELILNANKMDGATLTVSITEGQNMLKSTQVPVDGERYSKLMRLELTAGKPGTHHYVLRVKANTDEVSLENNRYDLFVDVLESKQKVLILANSPHPDVAALKAAITSNVNYEVDEALINEFTGILEEYSLVVLHQLPSANPLSPRLFTRITRAGLPALFILGEQSNTSAFNGLNTGAKVHPFSTSGRNEALPMLNESFAGFSPDRELLRIVPMLPPLNTAFAQYEVINAGGNLFQQKIGNVESSDPLWTFIDGGTGRRGVIFGTGIWKWRMKSFLLTGSHDAFNSLINKSIQFLALKEDKRRFRVTARESYAGNESIAITAELYNQSFEPVNEPDASIAITDETGNTYDYTFSRSDEGYFLDAAGLKTGIYTYKASARINEEVFTDEGGFSVMPVVAEQISLRASHSLLRALSEKHGGQMLLPSDMKNLPELLGQRDDVKPLIHAERKYVPFIDIWWVLLIIIGLLGFEWFIRKWSGSY